MKSTLEKIKIGAITIIDEVRYRKVNTQHREEMKRYFLGGGKPAPIHVMEKKEGSKTLFICTNGLHTITAYKAMLMTPRAEEGGRGLTEEQANLETLPAIVEPWDEQKAYVDALLYDIHHGLRAKPDEIAERIRLLHAKFNMTQKALAEIFTYSQSQISRILNPPVKKVATVEETLDGTDETDGEVTGREPRQSKGEDLKSPTVKKTVTLASLVDMFSGVVEVLSAPTKRGALKDTLTKDKAVSDKLAQAIRTMFFVGVDCRLIDEKNAVLMNKVLSGVSPVEVAQPSNPIAEIPKAVKPAKPARMEKAVTV